METDKPLTEEEIFKQKFKGVVKKWRTDLGGYGHIPQFITDLDTKPAAGDPSSLASGFLRENSGFLKINVANLDKGKLSQHGGFKHIRYHQLYKGIPVEKTRVMVHMSNNGKILSLEYFYEPALDELELTVVPKITDQEAMVIVYKDLGLTEKDLAKEDPSYTSESALPYWQEGFIVAREENLPGICEKSSPPSAQLIIYPESADRFSLAWKVKYSNHSKGSWCYYLDANSGRIIDIHDLLAKDHSGRGDIWALPQNGWDYPNDMLNIGYPQGLMRSLYWNGSSLIVADSTYADDDGNFSGLYFPPGWSQYRTSFLWYNDFCYVVNKIYGYNCVHFFYYGYPISYWDYHIPSGNPLDPAASFDNINVFYHLTDSLDNFYDDLDFSLGYRITSYVHHNNNLNSYYDYGTRQLWFGHGDGGLTCWDFAQDADCIRHELQHAVTDKLYDFNCPDTIEFDSMAEAFSDYFATTQSGSPVFGEWVLPFNYRDISQFHDMDDWGSDPNDVHENSLIYSNALWDIRLHRGSLDVEDIDKIVLDHIGFQPENYSAASSYFILAAQDNNCTSPQIWDMAYRFAQRGISDELIAETFEDGVSDGWYETSGLWHISSYRYDGQGQFSLAYNQQPDPNSPPDYEVGETSGSAILIIEHLDEFSWATIRFRHWFQTESFDYLPFDVMTVDISTDEGSTWINKKYWDSMELNQEYWDEEEIILTPNELVEPLWLRFQFDSVDDVANDYEGWYIDNISIDVTI